MKRVWVFIGVFVAVAIVNVIHVYVADGTLGWGKREDTLYSSSVLNRYGHFYYMRKHIPGVALYVPTTDAPIVSEVSFRQRFYSIVGQSATIRGANYDSKTFLIDTYPEKPIKNVQYSRRNSSAFGDQSLLRTVVTVGEDEKVKELVYVERGTYDMFIDTRLLTTEQLEVLHK